jgi:transcriptional regulator of arginine metabolism
MPTASQELKGLRQRAIRELVMSRPVGSQRELVDALTEQGFAVTQATVSRDLTELGLMKGNRGEGHVYVTPEAVATGGGNGGNGSAHGMAGSDERLIRILADIPMTIGRSGLTLVLIGTPGTASIVAQAIDESTLTEQEGTLAGDNTLLVLFADEPRLRRWRGRFEAILALAQAAGDPSVDTTPPSNPVEPSSPTIPSNPEVLARA